jgi:hypothetical protein
MIVEDQAIPHGKSKQEETEAHQEGSLREYRGNDGGQPKTGAIVKVL